MRKLWITTATWPTSEQVRSEANLAGATEIVHVADGIPASLSGIVTVGFTGYLEIPDQPADEVQVHTDTPLTELRDRLVARLDNPSINTINEVKREVIAAFNDVLE